MPRLLLWTLVARLLGLLLLAAAGLKLLGLGMDPVAKAGLFSVRWYRFRMKCRKRLQEQMM